MNGFIEVTEKYEGFKVLLSLNKVLSIVKNDGSVFVETGVDKKGESTGIIVAESFDEIKSQIRGNS